jgi:nucleoid-associated protein YgaU
MSKHERHARAAARQEREAQANQTDDGVLDELEGTEELLKTSFTAGNEMKIAVAVISVLLVVFAAAVVKWMRHSSASKSTEDAVASRDDRPTADGNKGKLERQEKSPFSSSATSAKPTVVTAVPGTGPDLKPKMRAGEPDTWAFASDSKLKPAKAQDDRESTSSFRPRVAPGDSGKSFGVSADRNSPKASFGSWEHDRDARTPAAGQQPSDPFRSRPAVDGLRRDGPGTPAVPPAPNTLAADASKGLPRSDVGRIGNPSYGLADASRTMPRSGAPSLPSAASRAPGSATESNLLRSPDLSVPGPASASSTINPPRPTDLGLGNLGPANSGSGRRADGTYVVQFDDNYWSISQKLFGTGGYFQALAKHNAKKYPSEDRLKAGDVILAPSAAELEKLYPQLCPIPARRNPAETQPRTASVPIRPDGRRTYVVQEGDTLYDIARRELGKAARWSEIYDLNKDLISNHWLDLAPGTQILLPDAGPGTVSQRPGVGSLR